MRIYLHNFGCKLNQAEADDLKANLEQLGCVFVAQDQNFDLAIINLCSVTHGAEQGGRQIIHKLKRLKPNSCIYTTGCMLEKIEEIDGHFQNKEDLLNEIKKLGIGNPGLSSLVENRTRAYIKIQIGCNFQCAYCIVPYFRGNKSESLPVDEIIKQIKLKEKQGFKEIVITGVNILQYNFQDYDLIKLTQLILKETNIPRIRFSSLDPRLISFNFLELLKEERIMPHLHLSLQSGSDRILKAMNRNYKADDYYKITKLAQSINPITSITTDIIVGFPGEEEYDIKRTASIIEQVSFLKVHLFPYSKRPHTPAFNLENNISDQTKKERFKLLNETSAKSRKTFINKMIGKEFKVLFESQKGDCWVGYTQNYILVKYRSNEDLSNQIKTIVLDKDCFRQPLMAVF